MMRAMKHLAPLVPLALLAACGRSDATAGGVTASEARALDEAAEMIEERRLPDAALTPAPRASMPAAPAPSASPPPSSPPPPR